MSVNVGAVALGATATCLATGLGALPFIAVRHPPKAWTAVASAAAVGFMCAASLALLVEGVRFGAVRTVAGAAVGVLFIFGTSSLLHDRDVVFGSLSGLDARRALTIVAVMTIHSFTEGVGVGVSYGGGD